MDQTLIIQEAREITGIIENSASAVRYTPDEAIITQMRPYIRRIGLKLGTGTGVRRKFFTAVAGQQDYKIEEVIGDGVGTISDVIRSGTSGLSFSSIFRSAYNPRTAVYPNGYELLGGDFHRLSYERILEIENWRRLGDYDYEESIDEDGDRILVLIPAPSTSEEIMVSYSANESSITVLPDSASDAAVMAACVAMLDAQINRINSFVDPRDMDNIPTSKRESWL